MRKIKYSRVVTLIICIYIIVQLVINIFGKSINTIVLENEKIEASISTRGLLIREEYVVYSNANGKAEILVPDGDKIKKSQEVATIYSNNIDSDIGGNIEVLNTEIDNIKSGENNISKEDISKLNKEIDEISSRIQDNIIKKNYKDIDKDKILINKTIEERNRLLNNNIDSKKLETKKNQKEILTNKLKKNTSTLTSNISAIVSYKFDGNEEKYNLDSLSQITKKDIYNTDNKYKEVNPNGEEVKVNQPLLRLVNNSDTYIAVCVDKNNSELFELNQNIKLKYNDEKIEAKVDKIYEEDGNIIVVFKISSQNIGIYDTRVEEFDIIYKQIEGLKIPKSSIEVVDDNPGVYVVNQENKKTNFVKLDGIVYEDENYVYLDCYKNDIQGINSIKLYDEIILKPNSISKNIKIK